MESYQFIYIFILSRGYYLLHNVYLGRQLCEQLSSRGASSTVPLLVRRWTSIQKWYALSNSFDKTMPQPLTKLKYIPLHEVHQLSPRQSDGSTRSCNCMSSGAIAGLVIGTIAGTLLILWLIYTVRTASDAPHAESSIDNRRRRRRRHSSHSHYGGSRRGSHSTYVHKDGRPLHVAEPTKVYYKPE